MDIDDETLMALADGELDGEQAEKLHARIAADPALAERYALFTQTAQWAKDATLADPEAAVSPDLEARIRTMAATGAPEAQNVVELNRPAQRWQPVALAASLALVIGLSAGAFLSSGTRAPDQPALTADLKGHLDTLPSGAETELTDGRQMSVVASFTDDTGAFCREYETGAATGTGYIGVACRDGTDWSLRLALSVASNSSGYAPAASLEALDAFYTAIGASQPLSAEAEQALLK
jgi:hypothetical protein